MAPDRGRPGSQGEDAFEAWASSTVMERYHLENKNAHKEFDDQLAELTKKSQLLEFEVGAIKERLNGGATTMTRHGDRLGALEDKQKPRWSTVAAIALVILPWIWVAASVWPTIQKFDAMDEKFRDMQTQQHDLQRDIGDVQKTQKSIDEKLDRALRAP